MTKRALDDIFSNDPLGLLDVSPGKGCKQSSESIYVGMYEEIRSFVKEHGREPRATAPGIAEAQLGTRLEQLMHNEEAKRILGPFDVELGILSQPEKTAASDGPGSKSTSNVPSMDKSTAKQEEPTWDDILSSELLNDDDPIFNVSERLKGTKSQSTNEYQARRTPCSDFDVFKRIFESIQRDLDTGIRKTSKIEGIAEISKGQAFIVGGLIAYVADIGEKYEHRKGHHNARIRVIFSNGMESDLLLRSFGASLYKDKAARAISGAVEGPLFGQNLEAPRAEKTGIVYVLKSNSELPQIKNKRDILHKIGVTAGTTKTRITNAAKDPTYLLADVEVVAEFTLYGLNPKAVERLLHTFFDGARAGIEIKGRFGQAVKPREWFFIPLTVIGEALSLLEQGKLQDYQYDAHAAQLVLSN